MFFLQSSRAEWVKVLLSCVLFPVEPFAFFFAECQNEKDGLASQKYFWMASEIDFIGSYF